MMLPSLSYARRSKCEDMPRVSCGGPGLGSLLDVMVRVCVCVSLSLSLPLCPSSCLLKGMCCLAWFAFAPLLQLFGVRSFAPLLLLFCFCLRFRSFDVSSASLVCFHSPAFTSVLCVRVSPSLFMFIMFWADSTRLCCRTSVK